MTLSSTSAAVRRQPPAANALSPEQTSNEVDARATWRFLAHADLGVTEVRVIAAHHEVLGIGFFDDENAFVTACAEANGTGNVYVGVQPRPVRLLEQAPNCLARLRRGAHDDDIEHVTALVLDLDPVRPKDTASTDAELQRAIDEATRLAGWLESRHFARPVRVMSGNGCHLWFAVPQIAVLKHERHELTERLKAFEAKVRGQVTAEGVKLDSIYNLSRIIKVAGTLSVKGDPTTERPHRLSRSLDAFERREDALLARVVQSMPIAAAQATGTTKPATPAKSTSLSPGAELTSRVRALLTVSPRLTALFEGRGKTAIGPDGRRLDTSSSGYDFSLALCLAHKGVTDPHELATALWHRPDGAARAKGERYIGRTVQQALALASCVAHATDEIAGPTGELDFEVSRVVVFDSDPPIHHLYIDGHELVLSTEELISPRRFKRRFVEKLRRIPTLPGRRSQVTFEDHVNAWLSTAEIVHQPPEASQRNVLKDEIIRLVDGLAVGESADDLDHGMALDVEGRRAFKSRTLLGAGRDSQLADIGPHELCGLMRELGCFAKTTWRDGKTVRVWIAPAEWPAAPTAGEHIDGEEGQS